jgi:integrase/recombinase XerD
VRSSVKRSTPGLFISKTIDGFIKFKTAEGLSQRTIDSYEFVLRKWLDHTGDLDVSKIKPSDISDYLAWMRTEYKPRRWNGNQDPLSGKSLRNIYITFRAFFGWLNKEFGYANPAREVTPPKFPKHVVEAFTKEEVEKLLKACTYNQTAQTEFRKAYTTRRPTANRDQAIVLTLLDTGLRASEFCSLTIGDVDMTTGKVNIRHGVGGGAKGGKGRTTYLGKVARKSVWRYLANREDGNNPEAPLFVSHDDRPFNRNSLRVLIRRMGERSDIPHVHPHKFRHTFAITYLRSGGDVFTLQSILGHGSLDMVKHYAQIAEMDVENAHRKASPADNWRL